MGQTEKWLKINPITVNLDETKWDRILSMSRTFLWGVRGPSGARKSPKRALKPCKTQHDPLRGGGGPTTTTTTTTTTTRITIDTPTRITSTNYYWYYYIYFHDDDDYYHDNYYYYYHHYHHY